MLGQRRPIQSRIPSVAACFSCCFLAGNSISIVYADDSLFGPLVQVIVPMHIPLGENLATLMAALDFSSNM